MELRHLRYFVVVAEELHFRRAAQRLLMAQPPLSQQIRMLEAELGVALFERDRRTVQLTDAGRVLLEDAYQILAHTEQAIRRTQRAGRGELGRIAIGYTSLVYCRLLPDILRLYQAHYPDVEIVLRDLVTIEQMERLQTNTLDVSFGTHASFVVASTDPVLVQEAILREPIIAVVPQGHALAARSTVTFTELAEESWIWFARPFDPTTYDYMMRLFAQAGIRPNITQEINQQHMMLSLVEAGLGISLVPASIRNTVSATVAYCDVVDPTPVVEFSVIWRQDNQSPILQSFLPIVRQLAQAETLNTRGSS